MPIFCGVGNFVWQRLGEIENVSAIAEIVVESDGTITGRRSPAYIATPGRPVLRGSPDPAVRSDRNGLTRSERDFVTYPQPGYRLRPRAPMTRRWGSTAHEAGD